MSPYEPNSADQIEEAPESDQISDPEPTSSWRAQFFPAENEKSGEKATETTNPDAFASDDSNKVEENRGSRMSSLNWFHSTIEYEDENQVSPGLTAQVEKNEHECAPNLTIPFNPIPQDSMEIYSSEYPEIEHQPNCAMFEPVTTETVGRAPSSVASFDTVIELDQLGDEEFQEVLEDGEVFKDSRSLSRDSIKSIIENRSASIQSEDQSDSAPPPLPQDTPQRPSLIIPKIAFPCDDGTEDTDGFISVTVQPPTPRAISPNREFCVGTSGPTVAEQLEAKMERQLAARNSLPYSEPDETSKSAETEIEIDPDFNDSFLNESDQPESEQSKSEKPDFNYAPEADRDLIASDQDHVESDSDLIDHYMLLADEIATDLVIDTLNDVTHQLVADTKHSKTVEQKLENNLEKFNLSNPVNHEELTRVKSFIETDSGLKEQLENITSLRSSSLDDCCIELEGADVRKILDHAREHQQESLASQNETSQTETSQPVPFSETSKSEFSNYDPFQSDASQSSQIGPVLKESSISELSSYDPFTSESSKIVPVESESIQNDPSQIGYERLHEEENKIEKALSTAYMEVSGKLQGNSEEIDLLMESSESTAFEGRNELFGVRLDQSELEEEDSVLSGSIKTTETNLFDSQNQSDDDDLLDLGKDFNQNSSSYHRNNTVNEDFAMFTPQNPIFGDVNENIFSFSERSKTEKDEFAEQVGSPQEGYPILKPGNVETELDIVNSCFTLTDSDKEITDSKPEVTFSTFFGAPSTKSPITKPPILSILTETGREIQKSKSLDDSEISELTESVTQSKSFNDQLHRLSDTGKTDESKNEKLEGQISHEIKKTPAEELQIYGFENPYFEVDFDKSDTSDPSIRSVKPNRSSNLEGESSSKTSESRFEKQDTTDQVESQAFDAGKFNKKFNISLIKLSEIYHFQIYF